MTQLSVIQSASEVVDFNTSKGVQQISAEAALFKGGAALAALKDLALEVAFSKAAAGRYRAACDIFAVAFPVRHRDYVKLFKALPWANKTEMASYLHAMEGATPGKSGEWNKKQIAARTLLAAMRNLPAFRVEATPANVVAEATGEAVAAQ